MKKIMGLCLSMILAVSLLSACGNNSNNKEATSTSPAASSTESGSSDAQKQVKLRFWGGVPPESGPQEAVDAWNKANPNIEVEYVRYVNDDTGNLKLETALLSNTDAPDIYMTYGDDRITKRMQSGMAEPLDDLIANASFDLEGIIGSENIKKFPDGKYYYLPANKNIGITLFNMSALEEAGETLPTEWTWDEFTDMALKLNKGERKGTMLDPQLAWFGDLVLITSKPKDWSIAEDGSSNFNSPAMKKGLEIQKKLEDEGAMVKYTEAVVGKLTTQNELLTGKAAMVPTALYMIRYVKDKENYPHDFKIGFAPFPQNDKGGNVNPNGGMGDYMSINPKSEDKEAAMQFISWYLQEGSMSMVPGGRIPTNKKADFAKITSMLIGDAGELIDEKSLQTALSSSYVFPTAYNVPAPTELKAIFREEMEKYLLDVQPIEKTLEIMKSRADEAIKNAK